MYRSTQLVSPRVRGQITHLLGINGAWTGRRHGIKIELVLEKQRQLDSQTPVKWRARVAGTWRRGIASTVWDAFEQIEREVAKS